jgi:SAM-dependent methyltransferase
MSFCPACGSDQTRIRFAVSASEAAQNFVLKEGNADRHAALTAHIERLWGGSRCEVRCCTTCDFGFADPYVAGDGEFYNLAYERTGYPSEKWEYAETIRDLETRRFSAQRVLEVGAGYGLFLDKIADRFVPRRGIVALEFNDTSAAELKSKGYTVIQQDIRSASLGPGFDAIFLFQVVEHMDRLDALFARLRALLAASGVVYMAVPNPSRIAFNEAHASLLDMPPNHIGRWSPEALRLLGSRHGLNVDEVDFEPFSISEYVKQDLIYAYLRRSHRPRTFANWSRSLRSGPAGKMIGGAVALMGAPSRVPVWRQARAHGELGGSLWARLSHAS